MTGERQQILPGFDDIPKTGRRDFPQPRIDGYRPPAWYELVYHPLDINFKGRLRAWLERSQKDQNFALNEVLCEEYLKLVRLYLYDDTWPNKAMVMAQVSGDPSWDLKHSLQMALTRVWRRVKHGPRAIEILNIRQEDNFIYKSIITYRIREGDQIKRIYTIDELVGSTPEDLRKICAARPMFERLKGYMATYFPDWNPEIEYL